MAMRDPYLDALEQLEQMRDRAFEAEAAIQRVREAATIRPNNLHSDPYYSGYVHACDNILRALDGPVTPETP